MRVIYLGAIILVSNFSTDALARDATDRQPTVIVDSHRLPLPSDRHVSVKGHLADGRSYSVRLDTASHSSRLIVRALVGKAKFGEVTLDLGRYPEMEVLPIVGVSPE